MNYFGKPKINPKILTSSVRVPAGELCLHCEEIIKPDESGIMMFAVGDGEGWFRPEHDYCYLRSLIGSVGHQLGLCSCNGGPGTLEDPKYMSKRQAALAAAETFDIHNQAAQLDKVLPGTARVFDVGARIGALPSPGNLSVMDVFCKMRGFPVMDPESRNLNARDMVVLEALAEVWQGRDDNWRTASAKPALKSVE